MSEIRCQAPVPKPRFKGEKCGWFVTRPRRGERLHLIGIVGHSSLADPDNGVYACARCGMLHEVRPEAISLELDSAA